MTARPTPRRSPLMLALALAACAPDHAAAPAREPPQKAPPASEELTQGTKALAEPLLPGLGSLHHPVTTPSALAQRYFDQGLTLIYAFNHEAARRSFEQAALLDPALAMAKWGVALSLGPNINRPMDTASEREAFQAVQSARALEAHASPAERAYIEALATRYDRIPGHDRAAHDRAYAAAMRQVARAFPSDMDAATLLAESLMDLRPWDFWTREGDPKPGTLEIVSTLERVLHKAPYHLGANHYYIHAVEASRHPERALPSAERLRDMAPGAGHLVHMPAHIYLRIGRYADASDATARAAAVDEEYLRSRGVRGFYAIMYYPHNLHFLAATASMEGRLEEALRGARGAAAAVSDEDIRAMPSLQVFKAAPLFTLARFGRWANILLQPAPPSDQLFTTGIWRYARGMALASRGRLDEAVREAAALATIAAALPRDVLFEMNPGPKLLRIGALVLGAEIATRQGQTESAIRLLEAAVRDQDALRYMEPSDWPEPVRHRLGAALLSAGRAPEAEAVYLEDLRHNPENGWALFGLELSLSAQGEAKAAAAVHTRFERAWRRADVEPH